MSRGSHLRKRGRDKVGLNADKAGASTFIADKGIGVHFLKKEHGHLLKVRTIDL